MQAPVARRTRFGRISRLWAANRPPERSKRPEPRSAHSGRPSESAEILARRKYQLHSAISVALARPRPAPRGADVPTRRRIAGPRSLPGRSDVANLAARATRCRFRRFRRSRRSLPLTGAWRVVHRRSVRGAWRDPAFVRLYRTRSTTNARFESGRAQIGRFGPRFGPDCALRWPLTTFSCP
jgi:hypothetical protein